MGGKEGFVKVGGVKLKKYFLNRIYANSILCNSIFVLNQEKGFGIKKDVEQYKFQETRRDEIVSWKEGELKFWSFFVYMMNVLFLLFWRRKRFYIVRSKAFESRDMW